MKCNMCGTENNDSNKFCINCGNELKPQEIICNSCGSKNEASNNYCITCGESLRDKEHNTSVKPVVQKHGRQNRSANQKRARHYEVASNKKRLSWENIGLKPVLITIAVIVISYFIVVLIDSKKDSDISPQNPIELKSTNPAVESKVYEIASKFACSCGTCGEESLEKCTCPRAVEERQFIRDYLERKGDPTDITIALANKYGYLKVEYAKNYNVDPSKVWTAKALQYTSSSNVDLRQPNALDTKATLANAAEIYSAFRCPCGQCSIDDLKDCNCTHKNGASEIKSFIGNLISKGLYTVNDIIRIVNERYGGKKI